MCEIDNAWVFPYQGYEVSGFQIDYGFGLMLWSSSGDAGFRIEGTFIYRDVDGQEWVLYPEGPRPALASAVALFGCTLVHDCVRPNGALDLAFSDGSTLLVEPDRAFEAWNVWGPEGFFGCACPAVRSPGSPARDTRDGRGRRSTGNGPQIDIPRNKTQYRHWRSYRHPRSFHP